MRKLVHEIWEEISDAGMVLHTCCLAGPRGEACRRILAANARLLTTFEAGTHVEAMRFYNNFLGREKYATDEAADHEPYPDEWFREQEARR
jgi:hypothetical protein